MHIPLELDTTFLRIDTSLAVIEARRQEITRTAERAKKVLEKYHRQRENERLERAH
jgi:hypothetical protein